MEQVNFRQCPSFIKVYSTSQRMTLPLGFLRRILEGIPSNLFLRNRVGGRQRVGLSVSGKDVFFDGFGWDQFVKNNNLVEGQFLVFYFDGVDTLDFKIYRDNGNEKIHESDDEEELEEAQVEEVEMNESEELEEKEAEDYEEIGNRKRGKGKAIGKKFDIFGADIFKSGQYVQPVNPYFVTKVRKEKPTMLYIPLEVENILEYGLPEKLKVGDPRGQSYSLEIKRWVDGRKWYKGKWRQLCEINMVGHDDRLICEFIKMDEEQSYEMQIHIVRAGSPSN